MKSGRIKIMPMWPMWPVWAQEHGHEIVGYLPTRNQRSILLGDGCTGSLSALEPSGAESAGAESAWASRQARRARFGLDSV